MTSTTKSTEILKTDRRGRVRVPQERQEALLDEFERSGLSGAKFAALCGVKYSSFAGWVQRRKSRRAAGVTATAGNGAAVQWLEAVVGGSAPGGALTLHLPGGVRMDITHRTQLPLAAELLRVLTTAQNSAPALPC
jgi:hypothetical protein